MASGRSPRSGRAGRLSGRKAFRDKDRTYESMVRTCCLTNRNRPHDVDCERSPSKCGDKVAFKNRERAVARAMDYTKAGDLMTAYRCDSCAQWHVGHPKSEAEGWVDE